MHTRSLVSLCLTLMLLPHPPLLAREPRDATVAGMLSRELTTRRYENWRRMKAGEVLDSDAVNGYKEALLKYAAETKADGSLLAEQRMMAHLAHLFDCLKKSRGTAEQEIALIEELKNSPNLTLQMLAAGKDQALRLRSKGLDFKLTTLAGRSVDLTALRGRVVLVDIWSTSCSSCVAALPKLRVVYDNYRDFGFEVVGIHLWPGIVDEARDQANTLSILEKTGGSAWINARLNKQASRAFHYEYGITSLPVTWLFDQRGLLVTTDVHGDRLEPEVRRLLGLSPLPKTGADGREAEVDPAKVSQPKPGR